MPKCEMVNSLNGWTSTQLVLVAQPSSDSGQFNTALEEKKDTPESYVPLAGENPLENSKGQEKIGNTGEGGAGGGDFSASCGQALSSLLQDRIHSLMFKEVQRRMEGKRLLHVSVTNLN
ncbi:hypothetical protein ACOMHN_006043 [Nucella lapillus]